ncbi:MAG: hypothetical protein GEU91_18430 [Rhizobiales bacterium]|nr:hypothetical protein [Hyphomicrobiales bacterium]
MAFVPIKDANKDSRKIKTTLDGDEHVPHHFVDNPMLLTKSTVTLASALTTGSSAAITVGGAPGNAPPGFYQLTVWGLPGTSNVDVEFSPDSGVTWGDTDFFGVSEAFSLLGFTLVEGQYRLTINSPGGGSSWNADLRGAE